MTDGEKIGEVDVLGNESHAGANVVRMGLEVCLEAVEGVGGFFGAAGGEDDSEGFVWVGGGFEEEVVD